MTGWLVAGIVVLGVVVLALALMALGRRFRPLRRALRRLELRAEQADRLRDKLAVTQEKVTILSEKLETAAAHAQARAAGDRPPAASGGGSSAW